MKEHSNKNKIKKKGKEKGVFKAHMRGTSENETIYSTVISCLHEFNCLSFFNCCLIVIHHDKKSMTCFVFSKKYILG